MALAIRDHYSQVPRTAASSDDDCYEQFRRIRFVVDISYGTYEECTREQFLVRWNARSVSAYANRNGTVAWRTLRIPIRAAQVLRTAVAFRATPKQIRDRLGFVEEKDINVVLDASGFLYSDQWGVRPLIRAANMARQWKRSGKRVVLMPQAFGPFNRPGAAAAARLLVKNSDLVYARDGQSFEYLKEAVGDQPHIRLAPDFTNLLTVEEWINEASLRVPEDGDFAVVVPNSRMLDKVDTVRSQKYIEHMNLLVNQTRERGLKTAMLLFDPNDARFAGRIFVDRVITEQNPRILKAIIGKARLVIGSRFHALVCALTQAVPAIASGWSHKYQALFEDYGCPQCLLDVFDPPERVRAALSYVLDEPNRANLIDTLKKREEEIRKRVHIMWQEIDNVIFGTDDILSIR